MDRLALKTDTDINGECRDRNVTYVDVPLALSDEGMTI